MAGIPRTIRVEIDVDSEELRRLVETLVRRAFVDGFEHGGRHAVMPDPSDRMTASEAYSDWRGWGPGSLLPGGSAFHKAVENSAGPVVTECGA